MLEPSNTPIKHVYFPEQGIVSVVAQGTRGRQSEVGLIGCEGMTGVHLVMGGDRSPHLSYVQVAGQGLRAGADDIREALHASGSLRDMFLRFAQAFMTQTAHTAVANGRGTVVERLARWILMAHDRVDGNVLVLTHEFIALMLNVRRAGVTEALNILGKKGLITSNRGEIKVIDRPGLEAASNGFYGIPEAEYQRLIGRRIRHGTGTPTFAAPN